jgi:Acidic fibroblast growth factor binding (FIBP).
MLCLLLDEDSRVRQSWTDCLTPWNPHHYCAFYRRQFDNVKRVFKVVEDMQGSVVHNIKTNFLLPEELARYVGTAMAIESVLLFIPHIVHM